MALPASTHSAPTYSDINLVPLRVNVVSDDTTGTNQVSIVETLTLDRYCWPVPLFSPIEEAIQKNAAELSYMILSDLEVHGMGRTVRHFTNRIELFNSKLQTKIQDQLIPQLRHVAKTTKLRIVKKENLATSISSSSTEDDGGGNNDNKRKRDDSSTTYEKDSSTTDKKEEEDAKSSSSKKPAASSSSTTSGDDGDETSNSNEDKEDDDKSSSKSSKQEEEEEETPKPPPPSQPPEKKRPRVKKASLVPVRLRLCVNGVRIHDDFIWDLSVPQCPIEFAKSLGSDLNLSDEAVAAIVTSIVEQLDGSMVDDTKDLVDHVSSSGTSNSGRKKNASAAWSLEHRVHVSNMQQLLTMHRPTTTTTTANTTSATTTTNAKS